MKENQFWEELKQHLSFPFDFDDVELLESDASGTVYIDLKDGTSYYLSINESEYYDGDYR